MRQIQQSKQLRYYYRKRPEKLIYQRNYRATHKQQIKLYNRNYYQTQKVKTLNLYNSVIHEIYRKAYPILWRDQTKYNGKRLFVDAYLHTHGRPKSKRKYSVEDKGKLQFHMIPELNFYIEDRGYYSKLGFVTLQKNEKFLSAKTLTTQLCHMLGFSVGTSIAWREKSPYNNKVYTHTLCFDGSGLDMSHVKDLVKLVELRIELGLKGLPLLEAFREKYALYGYLRMWKGNDSHMREGFTEKQIDHVRKILVTVLKKPSLFA